ncbi:MAG: hypothetical protein H0T49_01660 [Chloroflexia bacterium]|jgi:hypothetical protein|nr:hypothetical protein [Chloroflexia bacterium]
MADLEQMDPLSGTEIVSPTVRTIISHLCQDPCHTYGAVLEWCETRNDCCYAVLCPGCSAQFLVDDEELAELRRWTTSEGHALVCGVQWE